MINRIILLLSARASVNRRERTIGKLSVTWGRSDKNEEGLGIHCPDRMCVSYTQAPVQISRNACQQFFNSIVRIVREFIAGNHRDCTN